MQAITQQEEAKQSSSRDMHQRQIVQENNSNDLSYDSNNNSISLDSRQLSLNEIMQVFQ